jgi:UDP-N-acetylmuramoyl-tripeptide--D-alanyl-D-alanine ligase
MTALYTAEALQHALGGTMTRPFHATGVSIDTRSLQPGDLFVALVTETGDGHDYVAVALERGAAGALVHRVHGLPDDAPLLVVGDTLAGLTALGAFARERFTGAVAAITGSVGKTTTKEMLRTVLAESGATHAAVASYNNHWGVPLTLARAPENADYAIIEIGMNHPGEIAPLAMLAAPDVAVITSVEATHIGNMGSLAAIAAEKASIAQGVLQGGKVVLPADSAMFGALRDHVAQLPLPLSGEGRGPPRSGGKGEGSRPRKSHLPRNLELLTFGSKNILDLQQDSAGGTVTAEITGHRLKFRIGVPGRHMVMNALAALTAASALGADIERGAQALAGFSAIGGRGVQREILGGRARLLDESYNASSASMRAALSVLKLIPARRHVAVLGDMLELGDHSFAEHTSLAHDVREAADIVYACGPWMKFLFDAMPENCRGAYAEDSAALAPIVLQGVQEGDAILVKGSLGSRMRLIVQSLDAAGGNG